MPRLKRPPEVVFEPMMRSSAMREIDRVIRTVAPKEVTIALIGESGTGKEVLARRSHELSPRRGGPFVPINCAAIPEALFESELFGHERGAFTGASERTEGKIQAAEGGTLFLDEIGELPLPLQAKLLRFLEGRRYTRVGGVTKMQANIRLVVATLRPLEQDVADGRFRADLFYRIQGVTLRVPPLRERRADIVPLIEQFAAQLSARHGVAEPRFTRQCLALFTGHAWPGNVRELRNVIEVLCLLRGGRPVRARDLPEPLRRVAPADDAAEPTSGTLTLSLDQPLDAMVTTIVQTALAARGGNRTLAAADLGVSVRTLQRYVASGRVLPPRR